MSASLAIPAAAAVEAPAVLAIRPRALGDLVLLTAALRALARGFPEASLEVATEPRYQRLLEAQPGVARVWPMPRTPLDTARLIAALRARRVRVAVDFFGNPRTALVTAACGAPLTAGYALRQRARAYRVRVPREQRSGADAREFAGATHVRLAVAAGGVEDGVAPRLELPAESVRRAAQLLAEAGVHDPARTIGLVAAGTWPTKTWPVSHAAGLAVRLMAAGYEVLLIAGPGEARVTEAMIRLAPGLAALPPCDVCDMAAVIRRLRALAGTDSGPRHMAAAFGIPTFTWFGPTHPETWTAPGPHAWWRTALPCRACDRTVCPHWNCLPALTPDGAAAQVLAHVEAHGDAARIGSAAGA